MDRGAWWAIVYRMGLPRVVHDLATKLPSDLCVCVCVCVCLCVCVYTHIHIYIYVPLTVETVSDFIFLDSKITADGDCIHEIKRRLLLGRKVMTNLDSKLKSRDIICQQRSILSRLWFSNSHVWMWELIYKESWAPKNWCFWTAVLEKTLENPLDCKDRQPVHPKGDQSWVFIGRTDAGAETPILWPPDAKSWLIWKDPDAGKDWRWEEKGTTDDEMVGWHHRLNGHEFG